MDSSNNIKRMMDKRGQITAFIVIGILILFAVGFVLYIASLRPDLNPFASKETEIEQFIGVCLQETAKEAIITAGTTGGYIDVPENIKINEKSYFSFARGVEPKIPLWYYRGDPRIPTKEFIAGQISDYIVSNINNCFDNFNIFKERYQLILKGNMSAETAINDGNVFVKLNYPLEVTEKGTGSIQAVNSVGRTIDVKLGEMYNLAVDILSSETKSLFFENLTIDLLSTSPDFPFTGMDFSCKPKTWKKSDIVDFAKNMVYYNVQQTTVVGNRFTLFDPSDIYAQNNFLMKLSKTYPDIGVVFSYSRDSRFDLHYTPNDGEVMVSKVAKPLGSTIAAVVPICINTYHFVYDIDYPVLATLRDNSAFNGAGFIFNFAFPVTINHNQGDKKDFPATIFEAPDFNFDFCQNTNPNEVDIRVKDAFTSEEIYQAPVEFRCIKYVCDLNETTADGGVYRLMARLPSACVGGQLISKPEGYLEGSASFESTDDHVDILVKPLKKFKVNIIKHDSDDFSKTESLQPGETVTVSMVGKTESIDENYLSDRPNDIQLLDGDETYKIEALLVQDGKRLTGGYIGEVNVKYQDIAGKSEITFNLVQKIPVPITEQEQTDAASYIFGDTTYQQQLKPTFS